MELSSSVGIAVLSACSALAFAVCGCAISNHQIVGNDDHARLHVVAHCLQAFSDSFEHPPRTNVTIFSSRAKRNAIVPPPWFHSLVNRKNVRFPEAEKIERGSSSVAIYLDEIELVADGEVSLEFLEVYSFSLKFVHEFTVTFKAGRVEEVSLVRTIEL